MSRITEKPISKRPLMRAFMRMPIHLFRMGLGGVFGERFLMLTHIGRKSGLARYVVLEVVDYEVANNTYFVAAGWGNKADWYRNIQVTPRVKVQVKNHRFDAISATIEKSEAQAHLWVYAQKYPKAFTQLIKSMLGESLPPNEESCQKLAETVPLVALCAEKL